MPSEKKTHRSRDVMDLPEAFFYVLYHTALGVILIGRATKTVWSIYVNVIFWAVVTTKEFVQKFNLPVHFLQGINWGRCMYISGRQTFIQRVIKPVLTVRKPIQTFLKTAQLRSRIIVLLTYCIGFTFRVYTTLVRCIKFVFSPRVGYVLGAVLIAGTALATWQGYEYIKKLPSPRTIGKLNFPTSTHIYDRNGKLLYEIYREQNRTPVRLSDLPPYVAQATVATEDKDFYRHIGIAPVGGMLRALKDTFLTRELQGGSTITQQLVKSALLNPERTIERKIKEVILALWTEQIYEKDRILEMYLNQVPYGGAAYGIEEASKTYFGKPAAQLTLAEAALLAGLPRAPSIYSPYVDPEQATARRNDVLRRMLSEGFIDKETYDRTIPAPLAVEPPKIEINAPHFVFYVRQQLEKEYGASIVEEGGLRVTTTLDLEVQQQAELILKDELAKVSYMNVQNGAVLVTRPGTGEILAMVGSVDYFASPSGAFNVTTSLRQPGSSIKPVMYSLALENGYTAATLIDDSPLVIAIPGSEPYRPVNYDGRFHGRVPVRVALANSYNIPAVKVLQTLGVQRFVLHAEKLGIDTWTDSSRFGLSLTLGGGEVRMTDMAEAFGVFANAGSRTNLTAVRKIVNLSGQELENPVSEQVPVMDAGVTYIMSDILSDSQARIAAFGTGSFLEIPGYRVAVKTGTTNDLKDNWTVGYTPDYVVTVWVGNNDNTSMNQYLVSGITGAAPIWNRTMTSLLQRDYPNQPNKWFSKPANVIEQKCFGRNEVFMAGTERSSFCQPSQQLLQNRIVQAPLR